MFATQRSYSMGDIFSEIVFWVMIAIGLTLLTVTWADVLFVILMFSAREYLD